MKKELIWVNPTEGIADYAVMENILREFEKKGIQSIIICTDRFEVDHLSGHSTEIITVKHSRIPFLSSFIQNWRMYGVLKNLSEADIPSFIMVDWRIFPAYLRAIGKHLHLKKSKLIFEDRSPPSGNSIKSKLQWKLYDWSWKRGSQKAAVANVLVPELEKFIKKRYPKSRKINFIVTPSGVDTTRFLPIQNHSSPGKLVSLVYHGALDKGRGLLRISQLKSELNQAGFKCEITIIGDGKLSPYFRNMARRDSEVVFLGKLLSSELPKIIAKSDYGILPLPDALEWNVGSPLKVMEFAASGLKCLTTDVNGTLPFSDERWICRADRFNPVEEWMDVVISDLSDPERVRREKAEARKYAEEKMTWEAALSDLTSLLLGV